MKKSRSQQQPSLKTELSNSISQDFPDRDTMNRLEQVIENFLPGDFSTWEKDHSRWSGNVKTVDGTQRNPGSLASAWAIWTANRLGEEAFGLADQSKDEAALLQLEQALARGLAALRNISVWTQLSLAKGSFEKMSGTVKVPANMVFVACAGALQDGIEAARKSVASNATPRSKENRRAAAVVGECREIYTARGRGPAPEWARDEFQPDWAKKKGIREVNTEFVRFVKAIFKVLGINFRVDSALRIWRELSEISQVSAPRLSDSED